MVTLLSPFPNNEPHNPNVPNVIIEWFDKLKRAKSVSEKEKNFMSVSERILSARKYFR